MMNKSFVQYDSRFRPHYLAGGDYAGLIASAHFKTGVSSFLDRLVLRAQRLWPFSPKISPRQSIIISDIIARVKEPVSGMLLYDTGWYKDCLYVGFIRTATHVHFIRYFQKAEDILFFEYQNQLIQQYFRGAFATVPVLYSDGSLLLQQHVERGRGAAHSDHIENKIVYLTDSLLKKSAVEKDIREIIPIDFFLSCTTVEQAKDMPVRVKNWIDRNQGNVTLIPVHGDMTPWNIIINQQEQAVLVDYERAGWHVPYYDLFHYILQEKALADEGIDIIHYMIEWTASLDNPNIRVYLTLYLIDQLHYDLNSKNAFTRQNPKLDTMIAKKVLWLDHILKYDLIHDKQTDTFAPNLMRPSGI